jgi:hypothetical protein
MMIIKYLLKILEMNKVFLQLWEESNNKEIFLSDGCSLHIDLEERNRYISSIYKDRDDNIPDQYDRIVGDEIVVFVDDKIFDLIENEKTVKLNETSFQNLLKFEEIIFNNNNI